VQPFGVDPKLDLVDSLEVARMLGVSRTYVNRLAIEEDLPDPDGEIGERKQRVWLRKTIVDWATKTGRSLSTE
jgi:hypothetical protein